MFLWFLCLFYVSMFIARERENTQIPQVIKMTKSLFLFLPFAMIANNAFATKSNIDAAMKTQNTTAPRVLVAYFSMLDGNTGDVARAIVSESGGDIYRIMVEEEYPDDDKARKKLLKQQVEQNIFPALSGPEPEIAKYDVIFIGSPVWGNHLSQPVKSFLHKYDLSNKTVIPFVSHSGGGRGHTFSDVADLCSGCTVDTDGWSSWGDGRQRGIAKWVAKKLAQHY